MHCTRVFSPTVMLGIYNSGTCPCKLHHPPRPFTNSPNAQVTLGPYTLKSHLGPEQP